MKFKNLIWNITEDDILNLCTLLDKVKMNKITIDKTVKINGKYKVVGLNFEFNSELSILPVQNNTLFVKVLSFDLAQKSTSNPIVKKAIALTVNSITSNEGIEFDNNIFKIDVLKLVNSFSEDEKKFIINNLYIDSASLNNKELQISVKLIDFTIGNLK